MSAHVHRMVYAAIRECIAEALPFSLVSTRVEVDYNAPAVLVLTCLFSPLKPGQGLKPVTIH